MCTGGRGTVYWLRKERVSLNEVLCCVVLSCAGTGWSCSTSAWHWSAFHHSRVCLPSCCDLCVCQHHSSNSRASHRHDITLTHRDYKTLDPPPVSALPGHTFYFWAFYKNKLFRICRLSRNIVLFFLKVYLVKKSVNIVISCFPCSYL